MVTYFLDRPHDLVELVDAFCSRPLPQGASPALIVGNLYLASDLFHQFAKAGNRRCTKILQDKLPGKFSACLNGAPVSCGRIELEGLRHRITRVLQVWEREHMFSEGFLESFKV